VNQQPSIVGVGMTPMNRRDVDPQTMAVEAARGALADAGIASSDVGLVVVGNAMGGRLSGQGCIRGQTWLRELDLGGAGVINVDNSCAGGSSALHVGVMAALAGESPVLVVGVEKMWVGDRLATLAGIADALPLDERLPLEAELGDKSIFMEQNASWVRHQLSERGTTKQDIAATTVKSRKLGALNPLAQHQTEVTMGEVLASATVSGPLTRLMCSSFTDGAAAAILVSGAVAQRPQVLASTVRSGSGELSYHDRLGMVADEAWKAAGVGPKDMDLVEVHDATSAEELYAVESLGFFGPGEAGHATVSGSTSPGGDKVCVNPSGGLVTRGHPLGATGLCQIFETVQQLRGRCGPRQVVGARFAAAVNTGGIIAGDAALASMHVLVCDS
jgi:acetyl-CoA acetyltransferase